MGTARRRDQRRLRDRVGPGLRSISAAEFATDDPTYLRGLAYLLADQREDGSWHVVSRSKPFQPYFESGFPHGKDQFVSMAASGWATAALVLACPVPQTPEMP